MNSAKRILVVIDSSSDSVVSLTMAAELAAHSQAQIETLFVEDAKLMHLAGLPFASELDRLSGEERSLNIPELKFVFKKREKEMRKIVRSLSRSKNIHADFKVVRGHFVAEAMQRESEVLFMTMPGHLPMTWSAARAGGLGLRGGTNFRAPIYVYYSGGSESDRAILLAAELSAIHGTNLVVLLPADHYFTVSELKEKLTSQALVTNVRFEQAQSDFAQCAIRITKSGCILFVMPRSNVVNKSVDVKSLESVHCPLVLVA